MNYSAKWFIHKKTILSGDHFFWRGQQKSNILFLHGGWTATKERTHYLRKYLAEQWYWSIGFDHTGHGETGGNLYESSLSTRVDEAVAVIGQMNLSQPLTIVGSSMGGYIAIKLTERVEVNNLILFCPAVYHRDAYDVRFGEAFTRILRTPRSRERSDAYEILQQFTGRIHVFIGSDDTVIPSWVLELLEKNAVKAASYTLDLLDGVDHGIHSWLEEHGDHAKEIGEKISTMIGK